jgi:hypothetical protein
MILGGMFLLVVLFLPRGLVGLAYHAAGLFKRARKKAPPEIAHEAVPPAVNRLPAK